MFRRFVALGDSQTEGVGDVVNADGSERGWADRFAESLATAEPDVLYANLAVRGMRIAEVRGRQLRPALALEPDLASVVAGINDVIRPRFDLDAALADMDAMQRELRAAGATVLTVTFPVASSTPFARLTASRLRRFNAGLRAVAEERGALLLDLERVPQAGDPGLWTEDRLHLNPDGHRRLAEAMATLVDPDGAEPWAGQAPGTTTRQLRDELRWARTYLVPWVGRRLTGRSSGDGRSAKRPRLQPLETSGSDPGANGRRRG
jgi:lysophospholipase L1-like esterase